MSGSAPEEPPAASSFAGSDHHRYQPKHLLDQHSDPPHRPPKIARTEEEPVAENDLVEGDEEDEERERDRKMNPKAGMQRYLVAVEYMGTRFSGSQQQPNCRTVVGVLEEAFRKFIGQPVSILCSSRTDAGVHTLSNVCHVDVERISKRKPGEVLPPHEASVVRKAVNHFLQKEDDIMVIDVRCVPYDFHARYKAQERTYYYRLLSGLDPLSTFDKDRAWHVPEELNLHAMQAACDILVGRHDFSSFRASGCQAKSPVRTLDELRVYESVATPHFLSIMGAPAVKNFNGNESSINGSGQGFGIRRGHRCLVVTARARSFLYHQWKEFLKPRL